MSGYYAKARSNYFRVKDPKAFLEWAHGLDLEVLTRTTDHNQTLYGLTSLDEDGWPYMRGHGRGSQHKLRPDVLEFDVVEELATFLAPGAVAILIEVGSESDFYLTGEAISITSNGPISLILLKDIYSKTALELGIPEDQITRAEY